MWRRWGWVGIVLFVLVDAVLITMAVDHTRTAPQSHPVSGAPAVTGAQSSMTSPAATSSALPAASSGSASGPGSGAASLATSPTASGTGPGAASTALSSAPTTAGTDTAGKTAGTDTAGTSRATDTAAAPTTHAGVLSPADTVLLDMASDGSAIRATRGSCAAGGSPTPKTIVETSDDSGKTWSPVAVDSSAVERVAAGRDGKSWFVATDNDCTLVEHDASADGDWSTSSPDGAWALSVDPTAKTVLAPKGDVEIDCVPLALAPVDAHNAVVACAGGEIRTTDDGGKTWEGAAAVPGAVSISFVSASDGYALAATSSCAAQVLRTTDAAKTWDETACLKGSRAQAVTAAGDTVLAQVDGAVRRSEDKGKTWS